MPERTTTADLVRRYSAAVDGFIANADRTRYESKLFDMHRRTLIGQYCLADHMVWFLKAASEGLSQRQLAHGQRRLGAVPSGQSFHAMPWCYLVPRQNDIELGRIDGTAPDEDLAWLMEYWRQGAIGYYDREDALLPSEMGDTQIALDAAGVAGALELLDEHERASDEVQRVAARLEMLNFVISGEIRGRLFYHGPYPVPGGDGVIVAQEFGELDSRLQPWVEGLLGYPLDNIVCIREVDPGDYSFDLYGFMVDKGGTFTSSIRRAAVVTVEDGVARAVTDAELERLATDIRASIKGAYERFATWDDDFRIVYGIYHYLTEAAPFAEFVGRDHLVPELRARMESSVDRHLPEIKAMGEAAPVWEHWRQGGGFTPPGT